ncbi:hypothetical protein K2173_000280 [Erythroxylum novogranatense]|uniref:BHLH domain-containing protein n=1 Tax=Erythroxylum novogranatense TaxID=1862640 RepID=A0AAV8SX01_9ROSI|nr:hypothetical protein K2173_000280 [Erythroxylum novogranatense]
MALSFFPNLGSFQQAEVASFPLTDTEMATELYDCYDNFVAPCTSINPIYESDELFYWDNCGNLLPFFPSPSFYSTKDNMMSLTTEIFPQDQEFEFYQCPKRQKSHIDNFYSNFTAPDMFDVNILNFNSIPEFLPDISASSEPKLEVSGAFSIGRTDQNSGKKPSGVSLSAQSIAARERRRKITEKTQELGKLIPGGNKMNTAEMFQAAFKYVKFLQAQVSILELMGSFQELRVPTNEVQQLLLSSPTIQEKLYSTEKCLVPKEFVQTLATVHEIQSNPSVKEEIDQLLETTGGFS